MGQHILTITIGDIPSGVVITNPFSVSSVITEYCDPNFCAYYYSLYQPHQTVSLDSVTGAFSVYREAPHWPIIL